MSFVLGPELLTNPGGAFTVIPPWMPQSGTASLAIVDGAIEATRLNANSSWMVQDRFEAVAGKTYRIELEASSPDARAFYISAFQLGPNLGKGSSAQSTSTTPVTLEHTFTAGVSSTHLVNLADSAANPVGSRVRLHSASVREVLDADSTFTKRRQRVTDTSGTLLLLELTSPSFTGPMYVANDNRDWVSQGQTYLGVPFGFQLPSDVAGQSPRVQLVMGNVGTGFADELELLQPGEVVMGKFHVTDKADPDTHARTYLMPLGHVSVGGVTATAQAGVDFLMRQQAVRLRATEFSLPGIF